MKTNPQSAWQLLELLNHHRRCVFTIPFYKGPVWLHDVTEASIATDLNTWAMQKRNVYYSSNDFEGDKKPTKTRLVEARALQVDLDFSPKKLTWDAYGNAKEAAGIATGKVLHHVMDARPRWIPEPSVTVVTGGGVQCLWLLDEPTQDFQAVEEANYAMLEYFNGCDGIEASGTHNVDRLLRLPGSLNVLTEQKVADRREPALAELLRAPGHQYRLGDFRRSRLAKAPARVATGVDIKLDDIKTVDDIDELDAYCPRALTEPKWKGLLDRVKVVAVQARHPDRPKGMGRDNSRSGWVYDFCCNAVRCGIPDAVIAGCLVDEECAISELTHDPSKTPNVKAYLQHQLDSAHAAVAKDAVHALDLKEADLLGAPAWFNKLIKAWRATLTEDKPQGALTDADKAFKYLRKRFGDDDARVIVERNFGADYAALIPQRAKPVLNGKDLPSLVEAAQRGLPPVKFNSLDSYLYESGKYRIVELEEFNAKIHGAIDDTYIVMSGSPDDPKIGLWGDHVKEIGGHLARGNRSEFSADEVVLFRNGYLLGGQFREPTPDLFLLGGPDCDYDPDAKCPLWLITLCQQWGEDPASILLLQEMLGLLLVDDLSHQVMFVFIGPPRSGKGTIFRIIEALVGSQYCVTFSPGDFAGSFDQESWLGKTVAIAPDVRGPFDSKSKGKFREVALHTTGEDAQSIRRKWKGVAMTTLKTRILMGFNQEEDALGLLRDGAGALAARIRCLKTTQSFVNREDRTLTKRLTAELPGIANWALEGLARLRRTGAFTLNEATTQFSGATKSSDASEFMEEWLGSGGALPVRSTLLYAAFREWCDQAGRKCSSNTWFYARLREAGYDGPTQKRCPARVTVDGKDGPCRRRSDVIREQGTDDAVYCSQHEPKDNPAQVDLGGFEGILPGIATEPGGRMAN